MLGEPKETVSIGSIPNGNAELQHPVGFSIEGKRGSSGTEFDLQLIVLYLQIDRCICNRLNQSLPYESFVVSNSEYEQFALIQSYSFSYFHLPDHTIDIAVVRFL